MNRFLVIIVSLLALLQNSVAQGRKVLQITYSTERMKVDGKLNEAIWEKTNSASQFTQTFPKPDQASNYQSEVKVTYSDISLFVGAKLYQPKAISSAQMTARDQLDNCFADVFSIFLDTYDDHQNGFVFRVSSAGVQQDERLSGGGENGDVSWDAVWHAHTSIEEDYWIVEMEIPFSAIRFANQTEKKWGLNFGRSVRKFNESSFWNKINVQQVGFLAQSGQLVGLNNVNSPIRLFLFPYVSAGYFNSSEIGQPSRLLRSGGLDVKYGLSESFTLDLTLVPDFSQVISDNLVRNLSPFEQQLTENRPFFTEGTELFNKDDLFYSRRVGERPSGFYEIQSTYGDTAIYNIKRNPSVTTLLNAFKISGRTKQNVGIGIFNAIGAPMYASIQDKSNGSDVKKVKTEPLSNYNVLVIDKALKGQSSLTFTNTNVLRHQDERDANVSSLKLVQFDKSETYSVSLASKMSLIHEKRKTLLGTFFEGSFSKVSGKFTYSFYANRMSKQFDRTDLGLQFDFNHSNEIISWQYQENKVKSKRLQLYRFGNEFIVGHNTSPFKVKRYESSAFLFLLFKNFWDVTCYTETSPKRPLDFYQLGQFDQLLLTYPYWYNGINGSSDSRKKLFWAYDFGYGISNQKHSDYLNINQTIRYRFSPRLEMSVSGNVTRDNSNIGYAYYDEQENIPVVGKRDLYEYNGQLSMKYNLNPDINFTARFRHYNSFLTYSSFHIVDAAGEWQSSILPFRSDLNENFNLQNIDIFFNWIFKPGSRLVASYKQSLNDGYILNDRIANRYFSNFSQTFQLPKSYEVALRLIYFIDYSQVKSRKNS